MGIGTQHIYTTALIAKLLQRVTSHAHYTTSHVQLA